MLAHWGRSRGCAAGINFKQVAQLSRRGRAMRHVIEYFAKSLKVIRNDNLEKGVSLISIWF